MRVIVDHRQGYAWAGSLDPDVVAETVAEARDNAGFGDPDECARARPSAPTSRRSRAPRPRSVARGAARGADRGEGRARARARSARPRRADPRIRGVESARYGDGAVEVAVASSLGVEATRAAHVVLGRVVRDRRRRRRRPRPATASSVGPHVRRSRPRPRPRATRPSASTRLLGATPARVAPAPGDPRPARDPLGARPARRAFNGESMLKGRSLFVGPRRRGGRGRRT